MYYRPMGPLQRVPMAAQRYPGPYRYRSSSSSEGPCFITSAILQNIQVSNGLKILSTLKNFRDSYMLSSTERRRMVEEYYRIAPIIVKKIDEMDNKLIIYKNIYKNYILPAYNNILRGNYEEALKIYKEGIIYAKKITGV